MKHIFYIAIILSCFGCDYTVQTDQVSISTALDENIDTQFVSDSDSNDEIDDLSQFQISYIVCLDSGKTYSTLDQLMYKNANDYHVTIDTANRSYNKEKDLIALAEDDEDEMYAGEYFPRRFNSSYLSLEYLSFYRDDIIEKTIGLVAGIYDQKSDADSVFNIFKPTNPKAFVLKGEIYMGCMH